MKSEIEEFYDELGAETQKLVDRCPHRTTIEKIEAAKNEVYKRRHEIDPIMIIREVWKESKRKDLKIRKHEYEAKKIQDLKKQVINNQELAFVGWIIVGAIFISWILIQLNKAGIL